MMSPATFSLLLQEADHDDLILARLQREVMELVQSGQIQSMGDLVGYIKPVVMFIRPFYRMMELQQKLRTWYMGLEANNRASIPFGAMA